IQKGIRRIVKAGAKHILVINLPDIGNTPLARELEAPEAFTAYSELHNQHLSAAVDTLRQEYPQIQWLYFDVNAVFKETLENAAQFGLNNTHDTCYDAIVQKPSSQIVFKMASSVRRQANMDAEVCSQYFFFDLLHPTQRVHAITAKHIRQLLDKEQVTFQQ
ncbi:MAG: SGNH/GDSL hydrolase family protein, partial [Methylococcales bacterium]|nr:SGNH/GDSL hydrolase family protein [Methylococcales bacterium]